MRAYAERVPARETERRDSGLKRIEPLDPPMLPLALAGMATWAIVGLVLFAFRSTLEAHGRQHWLWTCLAGFLLGIPGLVIMGRHDANRRKHR